jgi:diaminopimelate epimerase
MIDVHEIQTDGDAFVLNTGSPHYVLEVENLASKDVYTDGKSIRYNEIYNAKGVNVNFVEDFGNHYFVRTYERGVENETFACGTGVTAVSMAMAKKKGLTGSIKNSIRVPGGNLNVNFNYDGNTFNKVFLEGPATFVFEGSISL